MSRTSAHRRLPVTAGVAVPADRRFRRPDVRPGRRRPAARVVRLLVRVGLPVLLAGLAAVWMAGRAAGSDLLRVDRLVVHGAVRLTMSDVELLLEGLRGTNILSVDLEAYRERLLASTWIEDATLSRVLPSTIDVRLQERTPIAVARAGTRLLLVDASGVLIEEFGAAHRDLSLPLVEGLVRPEGQGRPTVDPEAMRAAARFLAAMAGAPDLQDRVSEVDVSSPADVVVLMDGDPAWLHLGDEAFVERLERYLEWAPALRGQGAELDYVDLRFGERIVVRTAGRQTEWSRD